MAVFADPADTGRRLADLGLIGFWECGSRAGRSKVSPEFARFCGMTCCEGGPDDAGVAASISAAPLMTDSPLAQPRETGTHGPST